MELITFRLSRHQKENHLIFDETENPKSYASAILLKKYYEELEDPGDWYTDWRYYFIVRRHWLRKQKQKHDGTWHCHYCEREITQMPERNKKHQNLHNCVTIDHKVPKSEGIDELDTKNFLVSCYRCNTKKKSTPYEIFMSAIAWAREQKKNKLKKAA